MYYGVLYGGRGWATKWAKNVLRNVYDPIPNSDESILCTVLRFLSEGGRYYDIKKRKLKNIENWTFGGFSKFQIFRKFGLFFLKIPILFRKYYRLVWCNSA